MNTHYEITIKNNTMQLKLMFCSFVMCLVFICIDFFTLTYYYCNEDMLKVKVESKYVCINTTASKHNCPKDMIRVNLESGYMCISNNTVLYDIIEGPPDIHVYFGEIMFAFAFLIVFFIILTTRKFD